jgi:Leucine-rich repeat (LRR) protein
VLIVQTNYFDPQTPYAREFLEKCEGQIWFIDALEMILNSQAKSLNTITSRNDFENVITLGLANQGIEGIVPQAIGELFNLRYLYLSQNKLHGEIPVELYALSQLRNLDLSNNEFTGGLSEQISSLTNLEVLLLHKNQLEGPIPQNTTNLSKLRNLDLAHNKFSGEIPQNIGNLTQLRFLSLSDNQLTGDMPESITQLANIRVIIVSGNALRDTRALRQLLLLPNTRLIDFGQNREWDDDINDMLLQNANNRNTSELTVVLR